MPLTDLASHFWNFSLPALAMALLMPVLGRVFFRHRGASSSRLPYALQFATQGLCGLGVLVAGMLWTGQDGRMATYVALVLVAASVQAVIQRG